jgi:hypothetical protein
MLYKLFLILFSLKTATCSCNFESRKLSFKKTRYSIKKEGVMPVCLNESSGLSKAWQDGYYWTHNDSGGSPELYMINPEGYIFDTLAISNANNYDWEDLAKDKAGNIYVGDFGNNSNQRKDLVIYKRSFENVEKITFKYPDQTFESNESRIFDCEAFFWAKDSLYLITKSWEKGVKHSRMYVLPDIPGDYVAKHIGNLDVKAQITGADISPNGEKFALISYGKILLFDIKNKNIDFTKPLKCIKIGKGQTEAIVFENDEKLIFTSENRKIYSVNLNSK